MSRSKMIHSSPQEIEKAFYEALETADLEVLMGLWADDEHVTCIHPGGPRVEGHHDVRDSWKEILAVGALQIRVVPVHRIEGLLIAVHNLIEEVMVNGASGQARVLQVNATNVYHKGAGGWKIVMRHVSPSIDSEDMIEDDFSDFDPQPTLH